MSGALPLSCAGVVTRRHPDPELPSPEREFRGAWVATVDSIDRPSEPGLPSREQRDRALAILDRCLALRLNALALQVRPQCDALYSSALEPWSYYLTGRRGQSPSPLAIRSRSGSTAPTPAGWSCTPGSTRSGPATPSTGVGSRGTRWCRSGRIWPLSWATRVRPALRQWASEGRGDGCVR